MAAMRAAEPRRERLGVRVTPEQKQRLERAAAVRGETVSSLVVGSALREAEQALHEREILTLAGEAARTFVENLLNPPPLTPDFLEALSLYQSEFPSQR
jgi:uncharacterized protein (DUF1778 family)